MIFNQCGSLPSLIFVPDRIYADSNGKFFFEVSAYYVRRKGSNSIMIEAGIRLHSMIQVR